jgi:hypothetical protein
LLHLQSIKLLKVKKVMTLPKFKKTIIYYKKDVRMRDARYVQIP